MIESLLVDQDITEIIIQSAENIWLEKNGQLSQSPVKFNSDLEYHNFLQNLFLESRLRPDLETPFADGSWKTFRVHYIQPPLSPQGPILTLRKRAPSQWTLNDLKEKLWAPKAAIDLIEQAIQNKKSILIVGATGTGKTSVLNACIKSISSSERAVIIEDTDEIFLPNEISVKLLTRQSEGIELSTYNQTDLVKQSLRMRPDRIIMGEVRGGEAKDLLLAFSSGHSGGLATLHAENERQALLRLEMLVQMGAPQWSLQTIRTLIQTSFSIVLVVERKNEVRRLASMAKIVSLEETGFCLEKMYSANC
jgi:pilus assembly protein CpaF